MLPVLQAFAFQEYALPDASSLPCIVSVNDENGIPLQDSYVVKIFQQHMLNHTCNEVYGAVLARHFDLKTPESVLVEISYPLIRELKKQEKYKKWDVTEGVYFATKYIPDGRSFTDTIPLRNYNYWELGNIFAFDVLIMNLDRQCRNPNIIIKNQNFYVIDHQLSLNIFKTFDEYLAQNFWDKTIISDGGGHLFRHHLRHLGKKNKFTFDEFAENLRTLKPEILYNYSLQLSEYDYQGYNIEKIIAYIAEVKRNESKFLALLDKLLL
jgi:hypothetical protein